MIVAFRTDASTKIGAGHVLRCLTLANKILSEGGICYFICRSYPNHLAKLIEDQGCKVLLLRGPSNKSLVSKKEKIKNDMQSRTSWLKDAEECAAILSNYQIDWLVVDHYALDYRWENHLRGYTRKLMVIDDLADRAHDCDLLLDQTYGRNLIDYEDLVPSSCKKLIGSKFILLRDEFREYRKIALSRRRIKNPKKLLVSLGGSNKDNIAARVLFALTKTILPNDTEITVVLGWGGLWSKEVKEQASKLPWKVKVLEAAENMAELMTSHDWAIGACGGSSWERACLGLPAVMITIAENQKLLANNLQQSGAGRIVGLHELDNGEKISEAIDFLFSHYEDIVLSSKVICDGLGASRVVNFMSQFKTFSEFEVSLRKASHQDCNLIYSWQLQPKVRSFARNKSIPTLAEHQSWFTAKLADPQTFFYIIEENAKPVGVVRLDPTENINQSEVSIYLSLSAEGKGIAHKALLLLRELHPQFDILAKVLKGNESSHNLFKRSGYKKIDEESYISIRTI